MPSQSLQQPVSSSRNRSAFPVADGVNTDSRPGITPEQPAAEALAQLLLCLLDAMERAENGIRADRGAGVLHEFRIACRRSRTLATQVKQVLPAAELRRFKAAFAWLSGVTGPCRDLDVFLSGLDDIAAAADVDSESDLDRLRAILRNDRRLARARLLRALRSKRYRRFKADWRCLLESAAAGKVEAPRAGVPIRKVADTSIWRVYRRLVKSGKAIHPGSQNNEAADLVALHELRKTGKKLRYLLESFSGLYPADEIRDAVKFLRKLQDNLGGIVDADVQAQTLQHLAARLELQAGNPTLITLHRLLNDCDRRHNVYLADFTRRFKRFTAKPNRKCFKRLFKPGKG